MLIFVIFCTYFSSLWPVLMKKLTLEEGYWQSGFTGKGRKKYSSRWHRDEKIRNFFYTCAKMGQLGMDIKS